MVVSIIMNNPDQEHADNPPNSATIIEEDWSLIISTTRNERFSASQTTTTTAAAAIATTQYETHTSILIPCSPIITMVIYCVESLTPLDMVELWNGRGDATGNKVWMGALFFIEVFVCPLPPCRRLSKTTAMMDGERDRFSDNSQARGDGEEEIKEEERYVLRTALMEWRTRLFHEKKILELGAGTGAAGIALMLAAATAEDDTSSKGDKETAIEPSCVVLSDSDENILSLCLKNCKANLAYGNSFPHNTKVTSSNLPIEMGHRQQVALECPYEICKLDWMHHDTVNEQLGRVSQYDTIVATDVLYDISSLKPLIQTAAHWIKPGGYFVLSHIPRASIHDNNGGSTFGTGLELEELILQEAVLCGFKPVDILDRSDFYPSSEEERQPNLQRKSQRQSTSGCQDKMTVIRPRDLMKILNAGSRMMSSPDLGYEDMEAAEAAILFFSMGMRN